MSGLLVLGWHNVESTWSFPAEPGAGLRGLGRQLGWLRRVAHVVPLQPALERLAQGRALPARAVALTFDDGYADNLALAAPLLSRLGLPATFFLLPGLLDGQVRAWWEDLAWAFADADPRGRGRSDREPRQGRLDPDPGLETVEQRRVAYRQVAGQLKQVDRVTRERAVEEWVRHLAPVGHRPGPELFLDWDGAQELVRRGFAVGSHSTYHAILSRETAGAQATDLAHAAARLRERLGTAIDLLAYPNGSAADYDAATTVAAAAAGHRYAVTTRAGLAGPGTAPFEVPRFVVEPAWSLADTARQVSWWLRSLAAGRRAG